MVTSREGSAKDMWSYIYLATRKTLKRNKFRTNTSLFYLSSIYLPIYPSIELKEK